MLACAYGAEKAQEYFATWAETFDGEQVIYEMMQTPRTRREACIRVLGVLAVMSMVVSCARYIGGLVHCNCAGSR